MKAIFRICIFFIACFSTTCPSFAQFTINGKNIVYDKLTNTYMTSIPESSFGKDYDAAILLDVDSAWHQLSIDGQEVKNNFLFQKVEANKDYQIHAWKDNKEINTKLTFTFLPLLNLQGDFGYDFTNGSLSLLSPDGTEPITTLLKAKWRGGTTNGEGRHKRNYKIKTLNENGKSRDISFLGMREDNNWILDAGQIDLFRLRNRIATELWNDFATKPYYADKEPKAKSGVSGKVVEVILNNEYRGIYSLTEAMDRKELKLKKYDENKGEFHGQLWKASSWDKTQFWSIDKDYDNTLDTWHGFETKYPDMDDVNPTDYSTLYNAIDLVANSDDNTFRNEVEEYFDIPVLIDYHLLLEVLKPIDNCGKNMYWCVYDKVKSPKLTLAIWDLDASVGQDWHCATPLHPDYVSPNTSTGVNIGFNLYYRLHSLNVNNYNEQLENRYKELSKTYLNETELVDRYQKYYDIMNNSGAAQREERIWSHDSDIGYYELNLKQELSYIKDWLHQRFLFLNSNNSPILTNIKQVSQEKSQKSKNIYNILGQKVNTNYRGLKIKNGKKFITSKQ